MLLVEQVDRLSRLTEVDWLKLRAVIEAKQVRVVALDLRTSWQLTGARRWIHAPHVRAINAMMVDMLAAVAPEGLRTGVAAKRGRPEFAETRAAMLRAIAKSRELMAKIAAVMAKAVAALERGIPWIC